MTGDASPSTDRDRVPGAGRWRGARAEHGPWRASPETGERAPGDARGQVPSTGRPPVAGMRGGGLAPTREPMSAWDRWAEVADPETEERARQAERSRADRLGAAVPGICAALVTGFALVLTRLPISPAFGLAILLIGGLATAAGAWFGAPDPEPPKRRLLLFEDEDGAADEDRADARPRRLDRGTRLFLVYALAAVAEVWAATTAVADANARVAAQTGPPIRILSVSLDADGDDAAVGLVLTDASGRETTAGGTLALALSTREGYRWQTQVAVTADQFAPLPSGAPDAGRLGIRVRVPASSWVRRPARGTPVEVQASFLVSQPATQPVQSSGLLRARPTRTPVVEWPGAVLADGPGVLRVDEVVPFP